MQTGRDAGGSDVRRALGEEGDELVPAAAVALAHLPDMAIVCTRVDQVRERELVHDARPPLPLALGRENPVDEVIGRHHPAQADGGGQALAHRTDVHDPVRVQALQGADRLA